MVATRSLDEYPSVNILSIADIRLSVPQVSASVYKGWEVHTSGRHSESVLWTPDHFSRPAQIFLFLSSFEVSLLRVSRECTIIAA